MLQRNARSGSSSHLRRGAMIMIASFLVVR